MVQFSVFLIGERQYMFTGFFFLIETIDFNALDSVLFANEKVHNIILPLLPVNLVTS